MAFFERDGISLGYTDGGRADGPAIAFLHGLSMSRATWDPLLTNLDGRFRLVRLDQRGHGESSHAPGTYVLDTYLADTIAFLEEVVGEPSFVVGHSLGGVIAHGLAQLRPDLVRSAILEDPPLYVVDRMREGQTREEASPVAVVFPLIQRICRDMQARGAPLDEYVAMVGAAPTLSGKGNMGDVVGPRATRAIAEALSQLDPEIFITGVEGSAISGEPDTSRPLSRPAVVLRADPALGPAFTAEDEARFLRINPHARVVLFEGASHQIHDEQPERFLEELLAATLAAGA